MSAKQPVVLIILDGFGYNESAQYNAIANAQALFWQSLWNKGPRIADWHLRYGGGLPEGRWVIQKSVT